MNFARIACLASILAVIGLGCVTLESGEKIDPNLVSQIQKNVTTRSQVEGILGPPMRVDLVSVGNRLLSYWYRQVYDRGTGLLVPNAGSTVRHQKLIIWIGPDNVVKDYEFTDYLTDRSFNGPTEVVRRAAVPTGPTTTPARWFSGGTEE